MTERMKKEKLGENMENEREEKQKRGKGLERKVSSKYFAKHVCMLFILNYLSN